MNKSTAHSSLTYMPQLDSLRAVAVSMVVFSHWAGYHKGAWTDTFWFNGQIGVQLFFVLSGYLITGILLTERDKASREDIPIKHVLKVFYVRRVLRIFPLFYLTLIVAYMLREPYVVQSIKWHIPYLSNVYFALRGEYLETVSHFWSLAVEEQFYIFWPLLMLLAPRKFLFPIIMFTIIMGPLFRLMGTFYWNLNEVAVNVLTFSSLDTLGLGAMLALVQRHEHEVFFRNVSRLLALLGFVCLLLFLAIGIFGLNTSPKTEFVFRTVLAPGLLIIVWGFSSGFKGFFGKVFSMSWMIYLGRISYGIYVLHFFTVSATYNFFLRQDYLVWDQAGVVVFLLINLFVLISICSLSWFLFESRMISLKSYFTYSRKIIRPVLP